MRRNLISWQKALILINFNSQSLGYLKNGSLIFSVTSAGVIKIRFALKRGGLKMLQNLLEVLFPRLSRCEPMFQSCDVRFLAVRVHSGFWTSNLFPCSILPEPLTHERAKSALMLTPWWFSCAHPLNGSRIFPLLKSSPCTRVLLLLKRQKGEHKNKTFEGG